MEKLVFIGAGTHFHSVIDSFDSNGDGSNDGTTGSYQVIGILDNLEAPGTITGGYPVLGGFSMIAGLNEMGVHTAFISIGDLGLRKKLLIECKNYGIKLATIIDKTAIVSKKAQIRSGTFIGKGAIVNALVSIDKAAIINTGAIIEHDCNIGSNTHVSPHATICGSVTIGDDVFVGAGSVIIPGVKIGKEAIIGANSTILHDVEYQSKVVGSPARKIVG